MFVVLGLGVSLYAGVCLGWFLYPRLEPILTTRLQDARNRRVMRAAGFVDAQGRYI